MINVTEKIFLNNPEKIIHKNIHNNIVNVVSDTNSYVIISSEQWKNIQETIYLNSIKGMVDSINRASNEDISESVTVDKLDW